MQERLLSVSADGALFLTGKRLNRVDVSTDHGETWEIRELPLSPPYKFPEIIQLSSGNTYAFYGNTLYKYQYPLHNWENLTEFEACERIFGDSEQRLWKLGADGVLSFSSNEGATFSPVLSDMYNYDVPMATHNDDHNLYVERTTPENTLYHFTTSGQKQQAPLTINNLHIEFVKYNPYTGAAYILTNDYPNTLKRSTDGGLSWTDVDFTPELPENPAITQLHFQTSGAVWAVTFSGILVSNDEGETWTIFKVNGENEGYFPNSLGMSTNAEKIFVYDFNCGKQDFYRSLDFGATWMDLTPKFLNPQIQKIEKDANGVLYAEACRLNNVETSADEGQSWQPLIVHTSDTTFVPYSVCVSPNGFLFLAGVNDVFRSGDGGVTWEALGFQGFLVYVGHRIVATPNGTLFIYNWQNDVYRSTDNGTSWSLVTVGPAFFTSTFPSDHFHPNGKYYKANNDSIYEYNVDLDELGYVNQPGDYLHSFTVTKTGRMIAIVSDINTFFDLEIYISDDEGQSFQKVGNTPEWSQDILLLSGPDIVLLKLGGNYYRSLDDGSTWELYFTGAVFQASPLCFYFSPDHYFYVGLFGEAIYRSEAKLVSAKDLPETKVSLSVFPNPVSDQLKITASSSIAGKLQLKVLNAYGQIALQHNTLDLSNGSTVVDFQGLAPGLFYCEVLDFKGNRLFSGKLIKN